MGLGTPRETLRLVRTTRRDAPDDDDADGHRSHRRHERAGRTGGSRSWRATKDLCGYVLKKDSPSCGMERVKIYGAAGCPSATAADCLRRRCCERFPLLPVEEEGRLIDPRLRENFIERVFAYRRLKDLFCRHAGRSARSSRFHTAHKMSLLAHSTTRVQRARPAGRPRPASCAERELRDRVRARFMSTLAISATTRRHTNVLTHMAGHLKKLLDCRSRSTSWSETIDEYRRGLVPLVVPLTLLRHHVRRASC